MEHVFVTGATGFVGLRLLGAIAQEIIGNSSHVTLRIFTRIPHPDYESVVCDLQSDNVPDDALNGVDAVSHLADYAHNLHPENKVDKLLGDECYSSDELQSLEFKAQLSLREMNETAF